MKNIVLQMMHITKRYPGVVALDDVSIDFEKGQVHALLGENGAGKSTLIKVLSGAVENDEGKICIDGKEYNRMTPLLSRTCRVDIANKCRDLHPFIVHGSNLDHGDDKAEDKTDRHSNKGN